MNSNNQPCITHQFVTQDSQWEKCRMCGLIQAIQTARTSVTLPTESVGDYVLDNDIGTKTVYSTTPVNGEKNNQLFIRVKGLPIIEFDRNLLAEDIFEVDFGGNYKLQITNENGTFVITNAMNGFGNNCYEKFKGEKVTFLDYYDYAMSIANQNANPVNGDKGLKEFYPMQEFPEQEKDETFSKTVLLFDEGDNSFCDLGYYDFKTKEWNILGDMSMKIICWCYPPNPTEFLKGKSFTHAKHKGYC